MPRITRRAFLLAMVSAGCATYAESAACAEQRFPDVVAGRVRASAPNVFDFDATVSSPYDTPQPYADGLRVYTQSGEVFGERNLQHDHRDEQPFTRDLYSVKIPQAVRKVLVQARDQKHGYGGKAVEVTLPGR